MARDFCNIRSHDRNLITHAGHGSSFVASVIGIIS